MGRREGHEVEVKTRSRRHLKNDEMDREKGGKGESRDSYQNFFGKAFQCCKNGLLDALPQFSKKFFGGRPNFDALEKFFAQPLSLYPLSFWLLAFPWLFYKPVRQVHFL